MFVAIFRYICIQNFVDYFANLKNKPNIINNLNNINNKK